MLLVVLLPTALLYLVEEAVEGDSISLVLRVSVALSSSSSSKGRFDGNETGGDNTKDDPLPSFMEEAASAVLFN